MSIIKWLFILQASPMQYVTSNVINRQNHTILIINIILNKQMSKTQCEGRAAGSSCTLDNEYY